MSGAVDRGLEGRIARVLTIGTLAAVVLLAVGGLLLLLGGGSPLDPAPAFDLAAVPARIAALQPVGFLWLGLLLVVATPASRVAAGAVGYARRGEPGMAIVGLLVLIVIAAGVVAGLLGG
ncbi:MAG TPA: DUF1634 domain-containing protein [Candidatus Limnocylindrales bacterium]|nr:DUF1634 domain-containing protein [Candidatus Limnocylindrales bacterium]